jgi:FkbM family methyltransferase
MIYNKSQILKLAKYLPKKISLLDVGSAVDEDNWISDISQFTDKLSLDPNDESEENRIGLFNKNDFIDFYECKDPFMSSFFKPNKIIKDFQSQSSRLDYKLKKNQKVVKLDSLSIKELDVIKIDTQGSEFEIIEGGIEYIKKFKPLLFLETWTYPFYEKIKLFNEIVRELHIHGYEIWGVDICSSFRLKNIDKLHNNISRERLSGLNLFLSPKIDEIISSFPIEKLKVYSFIFYLHGYSNFAYYLLKNINNDTFKLNMKANIENYSKYQKINELFFLLKKVKNKLLGKKLLRFQKFT